MPCGRTNSKHGSPVARIMITYPNLTRMLEDHVAGKGSNSLHHFNLVHNFIPMYQSMKTHAAKAALDKEWAKLKTIQRGMWRKSETNLE